jgi:pilus assembly protein Flp/PilA
MINAIKNFTKKLISNQTGTTALEYGLVAASISLIILSSLRLIGSRMGTTYTTISNAI